MLRKTRRKVWKDGNDTKETLVYKRYVDKIKERWRGKNFNNEERRTKTE